MGRRSSVNNRRRRKRDNSNNKRQKGLSYIRDNCVPDVYGVSDVKGITNLVSSVIINT